MGIVILAAQALAFVALFIIFLIHTSELLSFQIISNEREAVSGIAWFCRVRPDKVEADQGKRIKTKKKPADPVSALLLQPEPHSASSQEAGPSSNRSSATLFDPSWQQTGKKSPSGHSPSHVKPWPFVPPLPQSNSFNSDRPTLVHHASSSMPVQLGAPSLPPGASTSVAHPPLVHSQSFSIPYNPPSQQLTHQRSASYDVHPSSSMVGSNAATAQSERVNSMYVPQRRASGGELFRLRGD
jgi:hypothetical protein